MKLIIDYDLEKELYRIFLYDYPGIVGRGDNLEEAIRNLRSSYRLIYESMCMEVNVDEARENPILSKLSRCYSYINSPSKLNITLSKTLSRRYKDIMSKILIKELYKS